MVQKTRFLVVLYLLVMTQVLVGQTNSEKAQEMLQEAIALMDDGAYNKSIELLEKAEKLDPRNIHIPYEKALAYYAKNDYQRVIKIGSPYLKHKDVFDLYFQLVGNAYDELKKPKKAEKIYWEGIKKFPESGSLYLNLGVMYLRQKQYGQALGAFEKGIEVTPSYPSNYYWASVIYTMSSEEVWGMIYGEIFMNLERTSKRTEILSKQLYETYKNEIKISDNGNISVSFSQNSEIDSDEAKLPFGIGVYEPTLMLSLLDIKEINIGTLSDMRGKFVDIYFEKGYDKQYPNVLFDYQKIVKDAGHFEAYSHWILSGGDKDGFLKWKEANKQKWDEFVKWFDNNNIEVD